MKNDKIKPAEFKLKISNKKNARKSVNLDGLNDSKSTKLLIECSKDLLRT